MKRQTLFVVSKNQEEPYYEYDVKLKTHDGFILRRVLARNELEAKQSFIDPRKSVFVGKLSYIE